MRHPPRARAFYDRLLERVRANAGVRFASLSTRVPLEGGSNGYITVPGQDDSLLRNQLFEWNYVSSDYHRAFGIPIVNGRLFDARDEDQAAMIAAKAAELAARPGASFDALKGSSWPAIVSRPMARIVWPNEDPIGRPSSTAA